ncbi:MAG: hypothetical protein P4M09_23855 [Devosia sp.]|nr:hypothetical protein [Devosia sp.]
MDTEAVPQPEAKGAAHSAIAALNGRGPTVPGRTVLARRTLLSTALFALLAVTFAGIIMPLSPIMPKSGLDSSWALGMSIAAQQGMVFGKDISFTFGPLAAIYTRLYNSNSFTTAFLLSGVIALSTAATIAAISRRRPLLLTAAIVMPVAIAVLFTDILFEFCTLTYYLMIRDVARTATTTSPWKRRAAAWGGAFPIGILPLVKGTFAISSVGFGLLSLILLIQRKLYAEAIGATVIFLGTIIALWMLSGQPLDLLPNYFLALQPIISGYTEAMAVPGPAWQIIIFVAICFIFISYLSVTPTLRLGSLRSWLDIFAILLFLFLPFKEGFVRHDGHALAASTALFLLPFAALVMVDISTWRQWLIGFALATAAFAGGIGIQGQYVGYSLSAALDRSKSLLQSVYPSAVTLAHRDLSRDYRVALDDIRGKYPIRMLAGTTDIYSWDQAQLIASGNAWNPRPILQSYSAYEPVLAEANKAHLEGKAAPDNIVFALQSIDRRLPAIDDGASWPDFMSLYELVDYDGTYAYLRRRDTGAVPLHQEPQAATVARLGDDFSLPTSQGIVFMRIVVRPTMLGQLARLLLKPTQLSITLTLSDGSKQSFRTISTMMESGFVISPLVRNTTDFMELVTGNLDSLKKAEVVTARIDAASPELPLWNQEFLVAATVLHPPLQPLPTSVAKR